MPLLTLDHADLAFGDAALLDDVGFALDTDERVALIGRNGAGKSSLLRVLAGNGGLDDGTLWRQPDLRVAYVAQEPDFVLQGDVFQTVAAGLGEAAQRLDDYHRCALAVARHEPGALERLAALQHDLERHDAWTLHHRVEEVLNRLQLDGDAPAAALSGGGIKRLALARALVAEPEVLLLDEPTNHLDIDAIAWLESLIRNFRGAVVVITHDRSFMDAVATRIVELDRGRLMSFPGNFSAYQKRKSEMLAMEMKTGAEFDKFLAQEEVWIRKGVEARRTRNEGRVKRLEDLRRQRAARRERVGQVNFQLDRGEASGQLVAELDHVGKAFDTPDGRRWVIRDFSARLMRGDRIGLIGPNGAGKTTLLKLILGELSPDSGRIRRGTRQEIAYFDQFRNALDPEATLTDIISPGSEFVEIGGRRKHVISYLDDFLFPPQRARSPVKSLSGGERNRLLLARLFARPANVLVLDEPTNDLDVETLELLETLLQEYDGTVFLVSHDRTFLDNVITQTIAAEGDGCWREYVGGYSDWQAARAAGKSEAEKNGTGKSEAREMNEARATASAAERRSVRTVRLSFKEKRELEALPDVLAALETEQADLQTRLADPELYRQSPQQAPALQKRLAAIEEEMTALLERWEALESKTAE